MGWRGWENAGGQEYQCVERSSQNDIKVVIWYLVSGWYLSLKAATKSSDDYFDTTSASLSRAPSPLSEISPMHSALLLLGRANTPTFASSDRSTDSG